MYYSGMDSMMRHPSPRASPAFYRWLRAFDHTVIMLMRRYGVLALRIALGVTFLAEDARGRGAG